MAQLILALQTPRYQAFQFNPVNGKKMPVDTDEKTATQLSIYSSLKEDYTKATPAVQAFVKATFLAECLKLKSLGRFVHKTKEPYISAKGVNVAFSDKEREIVSTVTVDIPD